MAALNIEQIALDIASPLAEEPGALLPILHALQEHFAYIPTEVVPGVAQLLNLSRAEVHGVISFYDWFQAEPSGASTLYICRAESCQAMGSAAVEAAAKQHLGIDYHQTSDDGRITLQPIYCLGNCACSPAVMLDEKLYSRVSAESLVAMLDNLPERES
ncbi:MAG: formate dehydrogenase subunit gamma [Proteobacteria bacterium]|nr:formate dehydrogenase subunit gamma [Pseudomonadota bacterium]